MHALFIVHVCSCPILQHAAELGVESGGDRSNEVIIHFKLLNVIGSLRIAVIPTILQLTDVHFNNFSY